MNIRLTRVLKTLLAQEASYVCCVIAELLNRATPEGEKVPAIGTITLGLNEQLVKLEPGLFHAGTYGSISILEDWIRWPELHKYPALFDRAIVKGETTEQCGFFSGHEFRVEMLRYLIEKHGDVELTF
jgi:hypothetical protein